MQYGEAGVCLDLHIAWIQLALNNYIAFKKAALLLRMERLQGKFRMCQEVSKGDREEVV